MGWLVLFIICLIVFFAWIKHITKDIETGTAQKIKDKVEHFNFSRERYTFGVGTNILIGIDEPNQKIIVASMTNQIYINFSDILESEIIQDDISISKTSRSSQIGGAVAGGLLAGGVGAIVGGLSGKTESTTRIKKLNLKIVVDSLSQPVIYMPFLSELSPLPKEQKRVAQAIEDIQHWHSLLSVVINRNNKVVKEG